MLHYLLKATPEKDHILRLTFADGAQRLVDFRPLIQKGGVFQRLEDSKFFAQVTVSKDRRYLEWPGELDFCADALWLQGVGSSPESVQESLD